MGPFSRRWKVYQIQMSVINELCGEDFDATFDQLRIDALKSGATSAILCAARLIILEGLFTFTGQDEHFCNTMEDGNVESQTIAMYFRIGSNKSLIFLNLFSQRIDTNIYITEMSDKFPKNNDTLFARKLSARCKDQKQAVHQDYEQQPRRKMAKHGNCIFSVSLVYFVSCFAPCTMHEMLTKALAQRFEHEFPFVW